MAEFTAIEIAIYEALDEWMLKAQGVVVTQKNPLLFMQILRSRGLELVKLGDVQKIRHDQKVITEEVLNAYREMTAAKRRLELMKEQRDILKDEIPNSEEEK